jgi:hypothetical protein
MIPFYRGKAITIGICFNYQYYHEQAVMSHNYKLEVADENALCVVGFSATFNVDDDAYSAQHESYIYGKGIYNPVPYDMLVPWIPPSYITLHCIPSHIDSFTFPFFTISRYTVHVVLHDPT